MIEAAAAIRGRQVARYTLLEKLGAGGQGEVWRAHDETRGVDIALKVLNPAVAHSEQALVALEHEHSIASRLDHPCILKVFPPERSGDAVVLPMELAAGGDLRRLRGTGYLEIIPVLLEIAQALEHAHERGVIHRDLKPGNVLFDSRGRVKLADFGVAGSVQGSGTLGSGLSPFTASPEQLRGEPPTPADDIYGLGALAYELLSGYPPYYPHFDPKRAQEEPVPDLVPTRQIPPLLGTLVMRMLAKKPQLRPKSMREVIDDLDAAINDTLTFDFEPTPAVKESDAPPAEPVSATKPTPPLPTARPAVASSGAPADAPGSARPPTTPTVPGAGGGEVLASAAESSSGGSTASRAAAASAADRGAASLQSGTAAPGAGAARQTSGSAATRSAAAAKTGTIEVGTADTDAAGASTGSAMAPGTRVGRKERLPWDDLQLESVPRVARLEPIRKRRTWPYVFLALLAVAAYGVFYWLPREGGRGLPFDLSSLTRAPAARHDTSQPAAADTAPAPEQAQPAEPTVDQAAEAQLQSSREEFDRRLAVLDARGAGVWGGAEFASAKTRAAESVGAHDAGNTKMAQQRLNDALQLIGQVEGRAAQAFTAQLDAGEKALATGQEGLAAQAFDLAKRIDPSDRRATDGLRRVRSLGGVLPLLADAQNAESAHNYSRAAQDYSQALALDPGNSRAKSGLARANAAFGADNYAKAVGSGFAALGAGRLDDARAEFDKARSFRPNGSEAAEGLKRVSAALTARGYASIRQRATGLEAQERWDEAVQAYDSALQGDPSLEFAQQGKARAAARAELARSLQSLIDRPERLASVSVRDQARLLLQTARVQNPSGPVLRSQVARLELLLPDFDKPVRLSLVSDNATQVAIPSIGSFGTFAKREIELKPGKYTVIGTRNGYRDVRRDITVVPGQDNQTISVTCSEPI